jgi:uncharacterized protein YkwD
MNQHTAVEERKAGMTLVVILAAVAALLLALFLWLRPVIGSMGTPVPPNVKGQARNPVADGTTGSVVTQGPPASTLGPALPRPGPTQAAQAGITHSDEIERAILNLVNEERAKAGVGPLQIDSTLQATARGHSDDMFLRGYFAHDDPDGFASSDRIAEAHRQLIGLTSENIWMGSNVDLSNQDQAARVIMNDWMHSSGHRDAILKKTHTHIGVGVSIRGRDVRATQNFAAIVALTRQAVPMEVHSGQNLDLTADSVGAESQPEQFEFFSSDAGVAVGGTLPIAGARVPDPAAVPAGIYKLRFIFPPHGIAYWGPRVEVK